MGHESAELTDPLNQVSTGSTCSYTSRETTLPVVVPDGDLRLQVGQIKCANISPSDGGQDHEHELPVTFIVCSKALSIASRIWKMLLYGGFAESKPSSASSASDWLVELPEDNPKAMTIVLNIIHSQFETIPRFNDAIDIEDLYQLTRLSWVAWVMGYYNIYKRASYHLAFHCPVDVNGDLQSSVGDKAMPLFNSTLEPPRLHELLKRSRLRSVALMPSTYESAIRRLISSPPASRLSTFCGQESDHSSCEAAILGTMIKSLASSQYWPLPDASQIRTCFFSTKYTLSHINIQSPVHSKCKGLKERDLVSLRYGCATEIDFPSSVAERMAKQAEKSGLSIEAQSLDDYLG
ncbi:hypothetical protein GGR55DRAFT_688399 [Xylaria sp. FL0064]|nr:hypothetical protein GGR55DRAFT_688399 [Xylaria sp. FL0064]